ncbi:DNA adenine methylase [Chryseobacterium paludis]|uniref:DNA adenine methylase n=1 Tax=Chryseobacterium paludis TaxID=2956784 RepID=UPI0021BFF61D|nr:Dam family site-specific DNA-(adenine-N6)-methyltransferase [Chryseobacterium paludis]
MIKTKAKPFLRWAGGKRWLLKEIDRLVDINAFTTYHEPFIGGGSIYFHLNPRNAFISDSNHELINSYIQLRDHVEPIIHLLNGFENTEEFYYKIRKEKFEDEIKEAARFIYLNQTSFNGIFRVNLKGEYNVPFGHRKNHKYDFENLKIASENLKNTNINSEDFHRTIDKVKPGHLVFLDPPYTVAHNKNGFIQYNQKIFSLNDQYRLQEYIQKLKEIGAYYIMTNAAHIAIKEIFSNGDKMYELQRASLIGGKNAKREKYSELILTNIL